MPYAKSGSESFSVYNMNDLKKKLPTEKWSLIRWLHENIAIISDWSQPTIDEVPQDFPFMWNVSFVLFSMRKSVLSKQMLISSSILIFYGFNCLLNYSG